ncbi:DUF3618 domain-containing protein [Streptomyces sp. M19]
MGSTPEELRQETASTRTHLAETTDRLADKVSPEGGPPPGRRRTALAEHHQGQRHGHGPVLHRRDGVDSARRVRELEHRAQGNPVAAGLIAFGAGMLAGAMMPASRAEERAGQEIRARSDELVQPVKETAQQAAEQVKDDLREPAREAAESVRDTAREAGQRTTDEVRGQKGNG